MDTVALGSGVKEVTLLSHSMGCQLAMDALRSHSMRAGRIGAKITNVLLVAPDVDANEFSQEMQQMGNEILHGWARRQQQKKEEEYNAKPGMNRKEKKTSTGTRD